MGLSMIKIIDALPCYGLPERCLTECQSFGIIDDEPIFRQQSDVINLPDFTGNGTMPFISIVFRNSVWERECCLINKLGGDEAIKCTGWIFTAGMALKIGIHTDNNVKKDMAPFCSAERSGLLSGGVSGASC